MTKEVKDFFKEMQNNGQSFLFYGLYYNPSSVLGTEQDFDDAEEEYYKLPRYYDLMLNNNLLRFLWPY